MAGLVENLTSIHLMVWAIIGGVGLLAGFIIGRRDVTMGNITLVFGVLMWSIFIGLVPIVNNAIQPDGLGGLFSGRGFARFLEEAAPQAIFTEPMAHRIEVLLGAGIGAVIFSACGFMVAILMKGRADDG